MLIKDIDCGKGLGCTVVVGVGAAQPYYYVRLLAPAVPLAGKRYAGARNHFYHNRKYLWVPDTMASAFFIMGKFMEMVF